MKNKICLSSIVILVFVSTINAQNRSAVFPIITMGIQQKNVPTLGIGHFMRDDWWVGGFFLISVGISYYFANIALRIQSDTLKYPGKSSQKTTFLVTARPPKGLEKKRAVHILFEFWRACIHRPDEPRSCALSTDPGSIPSPTSAHPAFWYRGIKEVRAYQGHPWSRRNHSPGPLSSDRIHLSGSRPHPHHNTHTRPSTYPRPSVQELARLGRGPDP